MASSSLLNDPVGIGVAWPLRFDKGRLALTSVNRAQIPADTGISEDQVSLRSVLVSTQEDQKKVIRQAMRSILLTPQGTRFMLGHYGSLVDLVPFEVNDETTRSLAASYGTVAIEAQEPRVALIEVGHGVPADQPTFMEIDMTYQIVGTQVTDSAIIFDRETQL